MTMLEITALKAWFTDYCISFASPDPEEQRNISLKEFHTRKVCENIRFIGRSESLSPEKQDLAEIIALFHDLGRFEQYRRYKTFKDSDSINHAALSADILQEKNIIAVLAKEDQELILKSVRLHNVFIIPQNLSPEETLFLKLIRDADKLDIWRVFMDFFSLPETERASAAGLGFPDLPGYSPEVLATLSNRHMVSLSMLRTLNDFKLLQLSWVFDLNFTSSFKMLQERDYIDHLSATLPKDEAIHNAMVTLKKFVQEKLA